MITILPRTTANDVAAALVRLREEGGAVALGHVLSLVVPTVEGSLASALAAARSASLEHPSRVVALVTDPQAPDGLDAEIRLGADAGAGEIVVLRAGGRAAGATDTLVAPLLLPDVPTVAWWPAAPPPEPAEDPVGKLAVRRITDALGTADPPATIRALARGYSPGDTDLSWARSTPWRALLAAALDLLPTHGVRRAWVAGQGLRPTVDLVAGWLASGLGCSVQTRELHSGSITEVGVETVAGAVTVRREPDGSTATMRLPGAPDQTVSLPLRSLADCLMEDLRHLAPDPVYGRALTQLVRTGTLDTGDGASLRSAS
ncbi:glucose-6-phosphate dehydrogenase assembly protein OpcA [Georgenia daeguensis]|uniref:Glucose-6-phosphate dehydrogenase assembly protein OpcA n=1 Tax=Georgenia daeguensis TaxID=908355 RepID=A0ABP8EWE5_9MICO